VIAGELLEKAKRRARRQKMSSMAKRSYSSAS
jgi:hypothetical protein